jgi:hypothetical protein
MTPDAPTITPTATQLPDVAEALANALKRAFPPAIMTIDDLATVIDYSPNYVRNQLQYFPGFPKPLPGVGLPRFDRDAVMVWLKNHQYQPSDRAMSLAVRR